MTVPMQVLGMSVVLLIAVACSSPAKHTIDNGLTPACHIIYDAGSKGTRLYIYERSLSAWLRHSGPRTDALADPVRGIRGKSMADASDVVDQIVDALEGIRADGPLSKKGVPAWSAFDWRAQCRVETVSVLATAGMRLAEQQDGAATAAIWQMLNERLGKAVGIPATTRTLSGYEEGVYAWLAARESQGDDAFGILEMGGASFQVTYPCPHCKGSRPVQVNGHPEAIYSYSFLGWGQDEAWKKFGSQSACARGAGVNQPDWQPSDCAEVMQSFKASFAFLHEQIAEARHIRWYLNGSYRYMRDSDIDQFCRKGADSGFEQSTSCFRAVYLNFVLDSLGVPPDSVPNDFDWTLGAVICTDTQCLQSYQ